ncbi:hypothetical protein MTP10_26830 [Nonomuraea sp. 3-1Str]|uniref:hypothetical protein n=1 Tax=Nonomuraea sp. 3-1Str TaxID=2929801 RepID=UPI00285CF5F7|nr:hypothetical protein [Nonomuraea sp. 3-1Str]MDR8412338.1 hypothetical protein [Nonomuraea sp. 3-1Str]
MSVPLRRDNPAGSALRFATELIAWVATPWALASHSVALAVLSVVVLIGLPTLFSTPGDKRSVIVAVPGFVTILLVLLQLVAAVAASWVAWPAAVAVVVSVLAVATVAFEVPRWRWLLSGGARSTSRTG